MCLNFFVCIFLILFPIQSSCENLNFRYFERVTFETIKFSEITPKFFFSCNDLHVLLDESKHFVNLRRIHDNLLRKNHVTLSSNEIGHNFFKVEPIDFNVSEELSKADVYT